MALQKVDYVNQVTVITAENMNAIQDAIIALETAPSQGLTEDVKQALLQLAQKVAYIDDQGQTYYDDLYNAFYPPKTVVSITAVFDQGTTVIYDDTALNDLKQYLTVTARYDDNTTAILPDASYTLSGTLEAGTSSVTVNYNGVVTSFDVVVTARPTLSSITAAYTQSGTIYPDDTLDSLKPDLVVTAHYSDSSTQTVPTNDYTLSGTLTSGTSTITVSYGGKTTTFDVTVTHNETPGENLVDFSTGFGSAAINKTTVTYNDGALTCVCNAAPAYAGVNYWFKQAYLQQFLTDGKRYRLHFSAETISGSGSHIRPGFFNTNNTQVVPERTGFVWIENNGVFDGTWVQQSDVGNIFFFLSNDSASSNTYTVVLRDMWIKEVVE